MKFYTNDIVTQARRLKLQGVTMREISEKFGVTRTTLARWFFDIPSTNPNYLRGEKLRQQAKKRGEKYNDQFSIDENNAKVLTALIYWCEGYKYPHCNCIGFANSDINLVKTFLTLFRTAFNIKEEKFRAHLQMHDSHDRSELTRFWSQTLNIPENQFFRPTITKALLKMKRKDYQGTCTIKYYDASLYQEMVGIYEGFFKKFITKREGSHKGIAGDC